MSRADNAKNYFAEGYNCCQAVVLAFSDIVKVEKDQLLLISSSFGGGFGRLREVCGAFSGINIILGLVEGYTTTDGQNKLNHYANIRALAEKFKEANGGSIICRELIAGTEKLSSENPAVRTEEYKTKRPCGEIVYNATQILEDYLKEKGKL